MSALGKCCGAFKAFFSAIFKKPKMILVVGSDYHSPVLDLLPRTVIVTSVSSVAKFHGVISEKSKICVTHEEALEAIRHKMCDGANTRAMELFRNKGALRSMLALTNSDFYFKTIKIYDLSRQELAFKTVNSKYIVKPIKGFFGIGVRIISCETDVVQLEAEIINEIKSQTTNHPGYLKDGSLSVEDFLIEKYIGTDVSDLYSLENAEIAVDGYYNTKGKFVLLNIYHHPFQEERKYFHLLYYTSEELFERFSSEAIIFFEGLQTRFQLGIKSFPVHAEFKIHNGQLFLVEINPGRFGGLGLADLAYYAFGINPYEYFFFDKSFDWHDVWNNRQNKGFYFGWILVYRGDAFKHTKIAFNHEKFKTFIGSGLIAYYPIDYDDSVSAIAFVKKQNKTDLEKILKIEFNEFHS